MAIVYRLNKPAYYRVGDTETGLTPMGYTLDSELLIWLEMRHYRWRIWDQKFENGDGNTYVGCYLAFADKSQAILFVLSWHHALSQTFHQETML